jgi:hypothetical protein
VRERDVAHEEGLALFIAPNWRTRFRESLGNPKRRHKLQLDLMHFAHLDERFAEPVAPADQHASHHLLALRARGAPSTCYLLSSHRDLDRSTLPLPDALEMIETLALSDSTCISCLPGRLALFHDHQPASEYLLQRPPGTKRGSGSGTSARHSA